MKIAYAPKSLCRDLGCVSATLFVPLVARALGPGLFPTLDPKDHFAKQILERCRVNVSDLDSDPYVILNILWRTRVIKKVAQSFFKHYPNSTGVNLGCGLSTHFQWLDNKKNYWIDSDIASVMRIRRTLIKPSVISIRSHECSIDLRKDDWWKTIAQIASIKEPLFCLLEGVLMYLNPSMVERIIYCIGNNAPTGSQILFDFISPIGVGHARISPTMKSLGAEFFWGAKGANDLLVMHPRLRLIRVYEASEAYGPFGIALQWALIPWTLGPLYGLAHLEIN